MTARPEIDDRLLEEAIAWHHALERDDADWDAYTRWLEADPRHAKAFDEIAVTERLVDERIDDLRALRTITSRPHPLATSTVARRNWLYGSLAAALALVVAVPMVWTQHRDIIHATARGETKHLALAHGISVDLSASTRLIVKSGDPTNLELAEGDAYFVVAHDPKRTLSIKAGRYVVKDIGTAFGLNLSTEAVAVAVADGHVSVALEDGEATGVSAGEQLIARRNDHSAQLLPVQAKDVGSWRRGTLVYDKTPLSIVAADIARYSGKRITVDPEISKRPFSGVLAIGDGSKLMATLSGLMSLSYEEKDNRIRISAVPVR